MQGKAPSHRRASAAILISVLAGGLLLYPAPAPAQLAVYDNPNHVENIIQSLRELYAIYQRIEQIYNQIRQIRWMLQQLEGLEDPSSREVATLLYRLDRLLRRGEALVYSLEDLTRRYDEIFRGYEASDKPDAERREQVRVLLDTAEAVLDSTRELSRNYLPSQRAVGKLKEQLLDAETNAEVTQAAGLVSAWTGEEVSKLLQQTAVLTNLQAVFVAHQVNQRAMAEATLDAWIENGYRADVRYDASQAPPLVPVDYPGAQP